MALSLCPEESMDKKTTQDFSPEQKISILRQYLLAGHTIEDVCERHSISESLLLSWQQRLFQYGDVAFEKDYLASKAKLREHLKMLSEKLDRKRSIIARVKAELQRLKEEEERAEQEAQASDEEPSSS